ncbi:MAG: glycosyltransferase [Candidatus Zixiibacteriota bacterium]
MIGEMIERLAAKETGRAECPIAISHKRMCIVYPKYLSFAPFISSSEENGKNKTEHYRFDWQPGWSLNGAISLFSNVHKIIRLVRQSATIEMYSFSNKLDFPILFILTMIGSLFGVRIILNDYCFNRNNENGKAWFLYCLSDLVRLGDRSRRIGKYLSSTIFVNSYESEDLSKYMRIPNVSIAPRVMIYGDFEHKKIIALINRAFDIVKQKYPRTEFILICPAFYDEEQMSVFRRKPTIEIVRPKDENDLRDLYSEADILAVLSSGGSNCYFIKRANAAGIPVILNDKNYAQTNGNAKRILISRDSYSSLAGEIIKLVDDKEYYRTFSQP